MFQLHRIGAHQPQIAIVADLELDFLADQTLEQRRHFADHIGQLQHFGPQRLLARERQQLPGERGGAVGIGLDLLNVEIIAVAGCMAHQHEIAAADDRRQHIVEIVRDPAGKLANRLHLGGLRDLALEPRFLARILEAEQHRTLAQPAHAGQRQRNRLVGIGVKPHGHVSGSAKPSGNLALRKPPHGIRERALVFADHQIGRIWWRSAILDAGSAQECFVGKQEATVAVGHRQAQRQPRQQRFDLRQPGSARARAKALPVLPLVIEQQEQRRRFCRVVIGGLVGVGDRQVHHSYRRSGRAFARIDDGILLIGAEEADEILARHHRMLVPGRTRSKGGVGGDDRAIWGHDSGFDPAPAECAAKFARDLHGRIGDEIVLAKRQEPPHQVIFAPPGAAQFEPPAPGLAGAAGVLGGGHRHQRHARFAIAPRRARGTFKLFAERRIDRQPSRRGVDPEPFGKDAVRALQSAGTIGDRQAQVLAIDRGVSHRPVGRSKRGRSDQHRAARNHQGDRRQHRKSADKARGHQQRRMRDDQQHRTRQQRQPNQHCVLQPKTPFCTHCCLGAFAYPDHYPAPAITQPDSRPVHANVRAGPAACA